MYLDHHIRYRLACRSGSRDQRWMITMNSGLAWPYVSRNQFSNDVQEAGLDVSCVFAVIEVVLTLSDSWFPPAILQE